MKITGPEPYLLNQNMETGDKDYILTRSTHDYNAMEMRNLQLKRNDINPSFQ